jgi:hypothetical protein
MAFETGDPPEGLKGLVAEVVREVLDVLSDSALPPRQRGLRSKQAGEYIGNIDEGTLANWRTAGIGPKYRKIGNRVIYDVAELDKYSETHPLHGSGKLDGGAS